MRKMIFVLAAVAVVVLAVLFVAQRNRDERVIRKNLSTLGSLVEKHEEETIIQSGLRAKEIATYFLDDCRIDVGNPVQPMEGIQDLVSTAARIRQIAGNIKVSLSDISISVEEDRIRARVTLTAAATVSRSLTEKGEVYPRELDMSWERTGREWKIREIKVIETLH